MLKKILPFKTSSLHFVSIIILMAMVFFISGCPSITDLSKRAVIVKRPVTEKEKKSEKIKQPEKETPKAAAKVTPVAPVPVTLNERQLFNEAEEAQYKSLFPEALEKYNLFLQRFPNSSLSDQVLFGIGQIREIMGQKEAAIASFEKLSAAYPNSLYYPEAQNRLAHLLISQHRFEDALKVIEPLVGRTAELRRLAKLHLLAGKAHAGLMNHSASLDQFTKAFSLSKDPSDRLDAKNGLIGALLSMPFADLDSAVAKTAGAAPTPFISYFYARRLYTEGYRDRAGNEIQKYLNNYPDHELTAKARALAWAIANNGPAPPLELPGIKQKQRVIGKVPIKKGPDLTGTSTAVSTKIACLLPLTGSAAKYGLQVKEGIELAFELYQPQNDSFSTQLIIRDSATDPDVALQEIARLASDPDILALIGPLTKRVSRLAALAAEEAALPIISLSQNEGEAKAGAHVFQLSLTPSAQAKAVARYSVQILGYTRLAILHPEDDYGVRLRDAFWDEITKLGAEVVGVESYDPSTNDFGKEIENLAGVVKAERRVEAGHAVEVSFQAVFLPDNYKAIAMIAPQFSYHDITMVRLLGTTLWHNPQLLSTTHRYIQKAIIPTSFFPENDTPEIKIFVEAFARNYPGTVPNRWHAYGYDAGILLLTLMDQGNVTSRHDLVLALNNIKNFRGVTGSISFTDQGDLETEPTLLTVSGKKFKLVE